MKATLESDWYYAGWTKDYWQKTINKVTVYDMNTGEILLEWKENNEENKFK